MKVYTKTGDGGETSLLGGGRVDKDHPRIEAYGTVDELNSVLGLVQSEPLPDRVGERLQEVQNALLHIGSALADPDGRAVPRPEAWQAAVLEDWIDEMDSELDELKSFIVPGGSRSAALAHVARTVCRRAERRVRTVASQTSVPPGVPEYLNRLSDLLFVLARFLNARLGIADRTWRAGEGSPDEEGV